MKKIFLLLLVLVAIAIGYNWVKTNYGTNKLKVAYTIEDATKFEQSISTVSEIKEVDGKLNPQDSVVNVGVVSVKTNIDSVQATALINKWAQYWIYAPLLNSAVVINPDNTIEYSGEFDLNRAIGYATVTGVSQEVVDAVKKYIKPFGSNFPIYAKGSLSITDNLVNAKILDFKIGFVPITTIVNHYTEEVNRFFTQRLSSDSRYNVKNLSVSDGKINFEGNIPSKVEYYKSK